MNSSDKQSTKETRHDRFSARLWARRPVWLLGIPLGGLLLFGGGVIAAAGFNTALHLTNENNFCFSCHIGMDTIVEEYQASVHGTNQSGVTATCADCHVPKEFIPKMITKIRASKDVYHTLVGTYNLDNFESHRTELAEQVRNRMKARDSKECRNCHQSDNWQTALQSSKAQSAHAPDFWQRNNKTCVSCHIGVAHLKPR